MQIKNGRWSNHLGFLGIVITVGIGFLILYFLQGRTDSKMKSIITKISGLCRQQLEIINEEKEHRDKMKSYFSYHTQGSLKLIKHQCETLQKFITDLTSNRSEEKNTIEES